MSLELKQVRLGSRFPHPTPVQILNAALTYLDGYDGITLNKACMPLDHYEGQDRPTTDDGYTWFWSQNFRMPSGLIQVCIPWSQDWERKDGSRMDRSAAVYADAEVSDSEVFGVILRLTGVLAERLAEQERRKAAARVRALRSLIAPGTRVKTAKPNMALRKEWTDEGWASKKWGVSGKIITHHDSHGLFYDVQHDDGTRGCYDPSELEVVAQE